MPDTGCYRLRGGVGNLQRDGSPIRAPEGAGKTSWGSQDFNL